MPEGVTVSLAANVLFQSGNALLKPGAEELLSQIAVPLVARAIIIIKRYFIKSPSCSRLCRSTAWREFDYISLTCASEPTRTVG